MDREKENMIVQCHILCNKRTSNNKKKTNHESETSELCQYFFLEKNKFNE